MLRKLITGLGAAALVIAFAPAALGHVTIQPSEAPTGSFARFVVRVPNERPAADTVKVEVKFPETLVSVSFQPKEGWTRAVTMKKLDEPIEVFGEEVDEVIDTVTWSGGAIAPNEFDEFGFSARTPDDPGALDFAALQTYEGGEVVRWTGPPDAEEPAPQLHLVDAGMGEHGGELGLLADLRADVETLKERRDEPAAGPAAVILGATGVILGGAALVLVLVRRW